jgi:acetyl esterase/lipase
LYGIFDFGMLGRALTAWGVAEPAADAGRDAMHTMMRAYLGEAPGQALLRNPHASPLYAAARLPPCHVMVGGDDPLTVQSAALVTALEAAGVAHEHWVDAGMPHGYAQMEYLGGAIPAIERMVAFLKRTL